MTKEEALKVVTHTGDCYRIKSAHRPEAFNFYVSRIGGLGLWQEGSELGEDFVTYVEIESIERY